MAFSLLDAMAALIDACSRRVGRLRRCRRLVGCRNMPLLGAKKKRAEEEEVWRKEILMGEKCQPLDFSGVIYYDTEGKRLPEIPRSPMRSTAGSRNSLPSFSFHNSGDRFRVQGLITN